MSKGNLEFHDVTFTYDTAAEPVLEGITVEFAPGWTGVIRFPVELSAPFGAC